MKQSILNKKQSGYILLISVLVVGAVGAIVVVTVLLLGVVITQTAFNFRETLQARGIANACAEEALEQIRENTSFSGTGNLSLTAGSCSYTVIVGSGETRTIQVSADVNSSIKKVQVTVPQINPQIIIESWQR